MPLHYLKQVLVSAKIRCNNFFLSFHFGLHFLYILVCICISICMHHRDVHTMWCISVGLPFIFLFSHQCRSGSKCRRMHQNLISMFLIADVIPRLFQNTLRGRLHHCRDEFSTCFLQPRRFSFPLLFCFPANDPWESTERWGQIIRHNYFSHYYFLSPFIPSIGIW